MENKSGIRERRCIKIVKILISICLWIGIFALVTLVLLITRSDISTLVASLILSAIGVDSTTKIWKK